MSLPYSLEWGMSPLRVVVLGGYGFFGQRLVRRLARHSGLEIVVAGRSRSAAEALIASLDTPLAHCSAASLDIHAAGFSAELAALSPWGVVHTVGPFQGQDYNVARASMAAGAHYIDLADGRAFVAGIGELDALAQKAGLLVVSGASSVPALSSAVADHLAEGLHRVDHIHIGISPGNRTERGLSTVQSILSYCGQPIVSKQGSSTVGWAGMSRHVYPAPVGTRLLSPCDVPDLDVLQGRYPGDPRIWFGAGLELAFLHWGMNAMAWVVQKGFVRNWAGSAMWLNTIADWFRHWGTDAGAMHVQLAGLASDGTPVIHTWELVASAGDGPYVPTLAASALIRLMASGATLQTGARPCVGLLRLEHFAAEMQGLAIHTTRRPCTSLFSAVMGVDAFSRLHPALQRFHGRQGRTVLHGHVTTLAPQTRVARLLATLLGSPRAADAGAIRFVLEAQPEQEHWVREFPGQTMHSRMRLVSGHLVESLGPARLVFRLQEVDGGLAMKLQSMRFLGIPCPRWLLPRLVARERGEGGRLCFEIEASLPFVGRVAGYRGHLTVMAAEEGVP